MRFWVASTDYSSDVSISASLITEMSNQIRKLRNTARFMLGNLSDYDGKGIACYYLHFSGSEIAYSDLLDLDKYMLHRLSEFMATMNQNYDNFAFGKGERTAKQLLIFSRTKPTHLWKHRALCILF